MAFVYALLSEVGGLYSFKLGNQKVEGSFLYYTFKTNSSGFLVKIRIDAGVSAAVHHHLSL